MSFPVSLHMIRRHRRLALLLVLLCASGPVAAGAIHKWVDDRGVTHYSDEPPPQPASPVTLLQIETGENTPRDGAASASDHYYSIANQWQRMQRESELRQQRELQRAELKRQQRATVPEYREVRETRYVAAYPRRYHRRHGHGHYPPITPYGGPQSPAGGQVSSGFPSTN